MFIVDAGESFASDFVDLVEMMQIGGCVIFTTVTVAIRINRRELLAVFGVTNIDAAMWRIKRTVASLAGWGDTVKSIATIHGANEKIARFRAHAEKMARFVVRDNFVGELDDFGSFGSFGSVEGTDAVAVNWLLSH